MQLFHKPTQTLVEAEIELIAKDDWRAIKKNRFGFDWKTEKHLEVYKLFLPEDGKILGLMSLADVPEEFRIEINLLESSIENVGRDKEYEHIAGCLIAFACRLAFQRGYQGFVSLTPKTKLIGHYQKAYGFEQFGRQFGTDFYNSKRLIQKYLEHGEAK